MMSTRPRRAGLAAGNDETAAAMVEKGLRGASKCRYICLSKISLNEFSAASFFEALTKFSDKFSMQRGVH
jgi:hypothetical protein